MGIDMGDFRMMAMSKHDHCEAIIVNEDLMKYSRYSSSYTSRSANPAMNSIRVGRASRRRSSSGIQVRRMPVRSRRRGISHRRGKFIVVGMIVLGFLCASYFSSNSIDLMAPTLGAGGKASSSAPATPVSAPKDEWKRGSTPALYQIDTQWASTPYANDTLGESGCGPTCMAMVYVNLTGRKEMDPVKMCAYSENDGYVDSGATSWRFMSAGAQGLGLHSKELSADKGIIKNEVAAGHPVIAIMGPGDFTQNGHFIVICGIDEQGKAIIRDPNSEANTNKAWNLDTIISQARNFWAYSI